MHYCEINMFSKYQRQEPITYLLSPANDLVNGCLDHLSIFRNSAVLYEGFVSLTDHMLLLSVISVDDVLVF